MSETSRNPSAALFRVVILLSGWGLAAWLALTMWEGGKDLGITGTPAAVARATREEPTAAEKVEEIFQEWLEQPELAGASIGFCLIDEHGQPIYASPLAWNAMCPASALKTVTSGAAFGLLGPEFRFETELAGTAAIGADGVLNGDLVLVGGGDPTLSQGHLAELAEAVEKKGLKRVKGRMLVDASVFPHDPTNEFWNWGDVGNGYGAGAFGINVDHNRVEISFEPGAKEGEPAKLTGGDTVPKDTKWVNHVTTGPAGSGDGVVAYSEPYGRIVTVRGTVPLGESGFTVSGANPDPPAFAAEVLRARLETAGVVFEDGSGPFPGAGEERVSIAKHLSAPLPEIVDHLHRVSDNLETQCFFLMLGKQQDAEPADAVRDYWEKAGIEFAGLRLLDGSGLARAAMIRPIDIARINRAARHGPHGERFYESLTKYQRGAIRSKLGAMSGVRTEVGFLRVNDNREFTFAVMANGLPPGIDYWGMERGLLEKVRAIGW